MAFQKSFLNKFHYVIFISVLLFTACAAPKPKPLGPDSFIFLGKTVNQNKFDPYVTEECPQDDLDIGIPWEKEPYKQIDDPPFNVFALLVDTGGNRYTGTAAQLTNYRDAKLADYENNTRDFWREASFDTVQIGWEMPDRLLNMPGIFNDYFNRSFVTASLTTNGLSGAFPATMDGSAIATIHVRDAHDRNIDVNFAPNGTYADIGALVVECQSAFNSAPSVPSPWVTCSSLGGELHMQLANLEVKEGSFLRVKSGNNLGDLGLSGPIETPGDGADQASLMGLSVTYPLTLTGSESVDIEVRDKDRKTRRYTITMASATLNNPTELENAILPTLNTDFDWVESFDAGADRLGLRIKPAFNGEDAAVRVVGGFGHDALGLEGPVRTDGVVTEDKTNTVRGDRAAIVAEALSLHIAAEAADNGIAINAANENQLDALVNTELGGTDSFMVLFVDSMTGIPGKRAGASSGPYNIRIEGAGGYTYEIQVDAALQIGTGAQPWETWAHEIGHNLGMWDIYARNWHDANFDREWDYLRPWSMMNTHEAANHPDGWHKRTLGWLPAGAIEDIGKPAATETDVNGFTLVPMEYPFVDYADVGSAEYPARQLARIELSPEHWLLLENRQPGSAFSQNLPDDNIGHAPASAGGDAGGLLITDTVNPEAEFLYRSAVTTLNPHGTSPAPAGGWAAAHAFGDGDSSDLDSSYPAYDGIEVRVVDTVSGPAGRPEALRVEVERGPGDHLDLRIRPWDSPDVYGTHDIWIDWPGNGEEDYSTMDPPLGNGDETHWHPEGSVTNKIRVRVHNDGTIIAEDVVVRASVYDPMGMGDHGGEFLPLPNSSPQNIPAGGFTDFAFDWNPKQRGHTCVRAEIFSHGSALGELDLSNNSAQENVNKFHPTAGSPYEPVEFKFTVNNDFPFPIEVDFRPSGLPAGMDLELEHRWLELAPDEERTLRGRLFVDDSQIPPVPTERRKCNYRFNIHAFIRTLDHMLPFGGLTLETIPTKPSEIVLRAVKKSETNSGGPAARIIGRLRGDWPDKQQIDAVVVSGKDGVTYSGTGLTDVSGDFSIKIDGMPQGPGSLMLYYFGPNLAPSTLGPLDIII